MINLTVHAPRSGWIIENDAPPGSGRIDLAHDATIAVNDESGTYEVGLAKPAGKKGPIVAKWAWHLRRRIMLDASEIQVTIK